ncbi:OmpA family protein [bacterium]|nr:OmpA family protein [bacterium]
MLLKHGVGLLVGCLCLMLVFSGCASKKYVNKGFENTDTRIDSIEGSVEANQTRIGENERVIKDHEGRIVVLSKETKDALDRIDQVQQMALGKLLYQVTLDDDSVKFMTDQYELSEKAHLILDELVDKLIRDNKNIFIEIHGHTDSTGEESYNNELGLKRAESVRAYLSDRGIPLHRMSLISHGEAKPIADNSTAEGRSLNRRVVILILE